MKQRVMIASALTNDPSLLILDEPTSALDVSIQAQIMNLLKELKASRHISMLFITHDLALASDLCDEVAVVYAGQVRELGTAEQVLGAPADPYTQRLLASIPSLYHASPPAFLRGAPPDLREPIAGCRFAPRCPLVYEACAAPPPYVELEAGHRARCWRVASESCAGRGVAVSQARTTDGPVLRIEDLSVRFEVRTSFLHTRPIAAVTGVSLDLAAGETVAVVGESGSGKTTLGRATLRLVPAADGRVIFEGQDIAGLSGKSMLAFRRRAQAIFQDPFSSLSPYMRVGQLVAEPLDIHGPTDRTAQAPRVLDALEQVKLSPASRVRGEVPAHALRRPATAREHRPRHGAGA